MWNKVIDFNIKPRFEEEALIEIAERFGLFRLFPSTPIEEKKEKLSEFLAKESVIRTWNYYLYQFRLDIEMFEGPFFIAKAIERCFKGEIDTGLLSWKISELSKEKELGEEDNVRCDYYLYDTEDENMKKYGRGTLRMFAESLPKLQVWTMEDIAPSLFKTTARFSVSLVDILKHFSGLCYKEPVPSKIMNDVIVNITNKEIFTIIDLQMTLEKTLKLIEDNIARRNNNSDI